ncbi:hypothetical protein GCM10010977_32380 [Citricoccus zhacaiensis]|uniref:RES domain-containing protein n=1 Tax=Citricoccus zhacaiensis TaxID=489142 RepID=A0ABQ2MDL6_9MICC|nr:RES domain-containing protein [Citricoccus zhacaiensis]GGO49752.1 hypothetical protein GCM10010977_32380 [Citricoccus zhacaiensis]
MALLDLSPVSSQPVWRVGFAPEPLAWAGWEYAKDGRFSGRWDDANGEFRTTYLGASLYACLLEVLAFARKDTAVADELDDIEEDAEDAQEYPTAVPGHLDPAWLEPRMGAQAVLYGSYCNITASGSIAALRPVFISEAIKAGHNDFDAALLKSASTGARKITQAVSSYLYNEPGVDGIQFVSRHGDELMLWCVYEQPHEGRVSKHLTSLNQFKLTETTPELLQALELFGLKWARTTAGRV